MSHSDSPFVKPQDSADVEALLQESLRAVARGNVLALRRIYDLTAPRMLAELLQMLGDRESADAALRDCYLDIRERSLEFNPGRSSARAWLDAVARRRAINILRDTPALSPPEEVDSTVRLLHSTLEEQGSLPLQRMLHLAWCTARSPAEIARALQWPMRRVQQEIRSGLAVMLDAQNQAESSAQQRRQRSLELLAGAYALGALTPRTSRRFEGLMSQDIAVRRAWQRWIERLSAFALAIPAVRPPDAIWTAIARRIEEPLAPQQKSPRRWLLAAAALLAVVVAFVWTQSVRK